MREGVIIKGIGGFYYVADEEGVTECRARGRFRKQGIKPMVGDRVRFRDGAVEEILPRRNALIRPPVANIDTLAIVMAAADPAPDLGLVDRLIVEAARSGITPLILVNKTDLSAPDSLLGIYRKAGYEAYALRALEALPKELEVRLSDGITALAGNSGVGKSTLMNRLGFAMETGETSRIERGRHTTRHVELFRYGNGFIMDTPGFSMLELDSMEPEELSACFREFGEHEENCRFSGCLHIGAKASDCGVVHAVEEGEIAPSRYENYCALYEEIKERKQWKR